MVDLPRLLDMPSGQRPEDCLRFVPANVKRAENGGREIQDGLGSTEEAGSVSLTHR